MDTMLTGILSETESEYDRYWYNMEFCFKLIEQQQEMERFVNESLIIASGNKQAIQEMVILNESSFTDKIKGFFEKIKNFFKKIFSKFGASMTALFSEQKKYIDKYSNIIMKCKYVASDIDDVKDHFKGVPRIIDVVENSEQAVIGNNNKYLDNNNSVGANLEMTGSKDFPYNNAEEMLKKKDSLPEKINLDSVRNTAYEEFIKEGYWANKEGFDKKTDGNGNTDIDSTFRSYFDGSEDTVSWSVDQVESNFQTIINTTYSGDKYVGKLESIVTTVTKKMDEISNKMESYYKEQSNKIKQAIDSMKTPDKNKALEQEKKDGEQVDNAAAKAGQNNPKSNPGKPGEMESINIPKPESTGKPGEMESINTAKEDYPVSKSVVKQQDDGKYYYKGKAGDSVENAITNWFNNQPQDFKNKYNLKIVESFNYKNYFNEISSGKESTSSEPQSKVPSSTGKKDMQNATGAKNTIASKNVSNMTANGIEGIEGINDENKKEVLDVANKLLDIDIYNRQAAINSSVQISSAIARSMFGAFQLANKDFFWIIKHHVQWYLSNPGAEKQSENQTTRVKSTDISANSNVKSTPSQNNNKQNQTGQNNNQPQPATAQ